MVITHNIPTYSISWLSSSYNKETAMGMIDNYYVPENIEELRDLCVSIWDKGEDFKIVGHTSNIYFQPNTNIHHLISTKKLNKWSIKRNRIICECGVNVKSLTKIMVDEGVEGFAGLIDLPGTIGGGIYGNSSVSNYSIAKLLMSVEILCEDGYVREFSGMEMGFQYRSSNLKRHEVSGIILRCTLKMKKGYKEKEKREATMIHEWRKKYQPGPLNNLGTTLLLGRYSFYGYIISTIAHLFKMNSSHSDKISLILKIENASGLAPYLFGFNRFMWKDAKAHNYFHKYIQIIKRLYRSPQLEIEIW